MGISRKERRRRGRSCEERERSVHFAIMDPRRRHTVREAPSAPPRGPRTGRHRAPPPPGKSPVVPIAIVGSALLLGIVLFFALRGGKNEPKTPPPDASASGSTPPKTAE